MKFKITLTAKLPIQITKKTEWYLASCPALDVTTQGETEEVAKKNIAEALFMFLRSCFERGTLDAVLKECGFTSIMEVQDTDTGPAESLAGQEYMDVPLYLLSHFEESHQCHRA
jgi:predicted RNase H-like HicB family nuclease